MISSVFLEVDLPINGKNGMILVILNLGAMLRKLEYSNVYGSFQAESGFPNEVRREAHE